MKPSVPLLYAFVYVIVVCPLSEVMCKKFRGSEILQKPHDDAKDHHHHHDNEPCDVCPRQGRCVPKVQCPAHLRPGSNNPVCHIKGHKDMVGVCCFTGNKHAAITETLPRASKEIRTEDLKKAHAVSKSKLIEFMEKSKKLADNPKMVLNESSPSFGHHLSLNRDSEAEKLSLGAMQNLFAGQELKARDALSDEDIRLGFTDHADGPFCPPQPVCPSPPSYFKSITGICNNAIFSSWGAAKTGYGRLLPPNYSDGLWSYRTSVTGLPLASPREVSGHLLLHNSMPSQTHNLMFMQFGQFIVHDVSAAAVFTVGNGSAISCCVGDGEDFQPLELQHWACAPIPIAPEDIFYQPFGRKCMNFVRTQLAPAHDCSVGYANPMNGVTHLLDLSHIYGSNNEKTSSLRAPGGLLNTFNDFGRELPPLTERTECMSTKKGAACFESGDSHGNQVISLTILHTIWTREHNRIARVLSRLNPGWDEDRVFFESRRILQAVSQHIVYDEWLPLLLGSELIKGFDISPSSAYSSSYEAHVDPSISVEFAAAAMRFGHSIVDDKLLVPDVSSNTVYESISLPEIMFQPSRLRLRLFMDRVISGLILQPMQNVDPLLSESLTRYMFHGGNPFGLDLAAINIQRGRDFGLRSYNDYRKLIGLNPFVEFNQFPGSAAHRLASVYASPEDIDLWIGGLLEEKLPGSLVGATFANILADQFSRLRKGDRYFYENGPDVNPGAFTPNQLAEIKKVTLARILCDNSDGYELHSISPRAFLRSDLTGNEPVPCDSAVIPSLDLNHFIQI